MNEEGLADRLTKAYIKMRDARAELQAEFDKKDKAIEVQMDMVEEKLMSMCKELGVDSLKTPHGTVFRSVRTRYETNDWENMYAFIKEHDIPQVLTKGINGTNMKQFLDENPTLMPIGMNVNNRYTVTVRRKR